MKQQKLMPFLIVASVLAGPTALAGEESADANADGKYEGALKDAWLDGKLETALLFNEHLNSFAIDTDVKQGVAYLSGSVDSDIERDLAGQIAKSVNGIDRVESHLVIDGEATSSAASDGRRSAAKSFRDGVLNATLTARVKTHLAMNEHTKARNINVDSSNGVVTLTGSVESQAARDLAKTIAKNTNGTVAVVDNLVVPEVEEAE